VGKDADARSDAERSGCARAWKGGVGWPYALRLEDSSLAADERLLYSARLILSYAGKLVDRSAE
jgi:hypothetical protein